MDDIGMTIELPDDIVMMKQQLRRFIDSEVIPIERDAYAGSTLKPEVRARFEARMQDLGYWHLMTTPEHGGLGLGMLARVCIWEETGRTIAFPARQPEIFGPEVSPVLFALEDEELRDKYLYPSIAGTKWGCFALTEPEAGSDPAAIRSTALRDGGHYVINGYKRFITGAQHAAFATVMAVTDKAKGARGGISAFLVDMDAPGVRIVRVQRTMMDDEPCEIAFDNVRVPAKNLLGREGDGFAISQKWITHYRMRHAGRGLGVMERCLEMGVSYAKQRQTFGKPLAERQAIQFPLTDTWMDLQQLRLFVYNAAMRHDRGEDIRHESYMAKIVADRASFTAADRCLAVHGGIGFTTDLPIEKFWRDQRSMMITEGPEEVLKLALARHVFDSYG